MKKTILGLGILALLASCGGKSAEDVTVADATDACSCNETMMIVANDILDEVGDMTEDEMEADEKMSKSIEPKMEKLQALDKKCRRELEISKDDMIACDKEIENVMKKFEEKF